MINSNQVMTREVLRNIAPSIFATEKKAGLSEKYVFIPSIEVVNELEKEGWLPIKAMEMRCRNKENQNFQKHMVRFRNLNENTNKMLEVGDTVIELVMTNSSNGTSAFIFNAGMYRCVCSNQMVVSESSFDAIRIHHKGYDASKVIEVTGEVIQKAPTIVSKIREFKGIDLSYDEKMAFGRAAKRLRFDNPSMVETKEVLRTHRDADDGNDLYKVFNVVQENLVKGRIGYTDKDPKTSKTRHRSTREVKAIDSNIKLNQSLWTLADEMAKIKNAQLT